MKVKGIFVMPVVLLAAALLILFAFSAPAQASKMPEIFEVPEPAEPEPETEPEEPEPADPDPEPEDPEEPEPPEETEEFTVPIDEPEEDRRVRLWVPVVFFIAAAAFLATIVLLSRKNRL